MSFDLLALMAPRTGHFQPNPAIMANCGSTSTRCLSGHMHCSHSLPNWPNDSAPTNWTLYGPMTGGALLAQMIAAELGIEFYYAGRFTTETKGARYHIPPAQRQQLRGKSVAVVDDVINAGSAIRATIAELHGCGARPVAIAALLVLGDAAFALAAQENIAVECIARLANRIWTPAECPFCAAGVGLADLSA